MKWEKLLFDLVQIGLTVSLAALVPLLLRRMLKKRYPARAMCIVWAVLALRLLIPVQFTLPEPPVQITPRTNYLLHEVTVPAASPENPVARVLDPAETRWLTDEQAAAAGRYDENSVTTFDVSGLLAALWLAGGVLFLGVQLGGYLRFMRRLHRSAVQPACAGLREAFAREKAALSITRAIPLLVSPEADCPMLAGFFRPALYLPDESVSPADAAFIFRHELTHYRHGDLWLGLLLVLARAVQWFNPLVHLMARFAQEDIELACDDAVAKGMDGAERRAYGETILRSAAAQAKRRALVSCFTGDKKTLMRRFEGLFDKRVKKRGTALVLMIAALVVSLGCAFSVGGDAARLDEREVMTAAEAYAQALQAGDGARVYALWSQNMRQMAGVSDPAELDLPAGGMTAYALTWEPEDKTVLLVSGQPAGGRQAVRLSFAKEGGAVRLDCFALLFDAADTVDSLADFRLLYENDLGLPDVLGGQGAAFDLSGLALSDPAQAAVDVLRLSGGEVVSAGPRVVYSGVTHPEDDIQEVVYRFADGGEVNIVMVSQFGQGWLPQDWTDADGKNARTAADLTRQLARAVAHKSGQYLYPVLSGEKQAVFIEHQQNGAEEWYWKLGGSSPSYRDFVIVPGKTQNEYIAVFRKYGGGMTDYRSAFAVTVGQENGRSVITEVTECTPPEYTQSDLFKYYYESGLAWPSLEEGAPDFNGIPLSALTDAESAFWAVFGLSDGAYYAPFAVSEIVVWPQSGTEATVDLTFADGSGAVEVRMEQRGGYWLPIGLYTPETFRAEAKTNGRTVALPVGDTPEQAVANAAGGVPVLNKGDKITLLFDPAPYGEVQIADAVLHEDGTLLYDSRVTEHFSFSYTGSAASLSHDLAVETNPAEPLASTITPYTYRGVTLTYQSAAANSGPLTHTVSFVYRTAAAPPFGSAIDRTTYENGYYGCTLELPECFVGQGYAVEDENGSVRFGLRDAMPGEVDDPTAAGMVMELCAEPTAVLIEAYGEDWENNYPTPCKALAERNGMSYFLTFASDVQYDPQDEAISARYQQMDEAARALTGEVFRFTGGEDSKIYLQNERTAYLRALAERYAGRYQAARGGKVATFAVSADAEQSSADVVFACRLHVDGTYEYRAAERLWFDVSGGALDPVRTEELGNSGMKGMTLEKFLYCYQNALGLPVFSADEVAELQRLAADPDAPLYAALDTPEKGAMYAAGLADAYGSFAGKAVYNNEDGSLAWVNFRFYDPDKPWEKKPIGGSLRVQMRLVQADGSLPGVWLPQDFIAFDAGGGQVGGLGIQYSPYDTQVYAQAAA